MVLKHKIISNMNFSPSKKEFENNHNAGKTQLVWTWIEADLETPVSAYLKLCGNKPHCFLLESIEGGKVLGRYSVIGFDPDLIWTCFKKNVEITNHTGKKKITDICALESLRENIQNSHIDIVPDDLPPMAVSGLFGYIGYDMVRLIEDIPDTNTDDLGIKDSILIRPQILAIFDNVKNMICLVTPVYEHNNNADKIYEQACIRLSKAINKLNGSIDPNLLQNETAFETPLNVKSNTTREQYYGMVEKSIEYIKQGEIFQVVPGQRFSIDFDLPSFALYRTLRRLNPSPFMFHLSFDDFALVGSSPEILVRVRDNIVTIRPIAGTRKRGTTPQEDQELANDLLSDEKERAEHLMLLDLGRNDIGRVAEFGSIKVTDQFIIEYYSHVMHIVSNIEGKLKPDLDIVDALFAGFPAGTVSGAPKVRAMEIIEELENSRRSYYGGGAGYFSGNGTLDSCIALRTAIVKDGKIHVQAGGGVVADSDKELEYQESTNKAKAIIHAAELAIEQAAKK